MPAPTPTLTFAPEPVRVTLKSTAQATSLRELVESRCPSLFSKCRPPWWLRSGHLQTLYAVVGDFSKQDQVWYQRRLLRLLDGGTLGLDFTPADSNSVPPDAPIIVVNHGLTGGSHEPYVRAILAPACTPVSQGGLGYRAVVVNFRGCSGVPITSPKFYTAAQTDDLRQALMFISSLYPDAPLLGLGFSIGGNVMMRYLAEEGPRSRLSSACILGCPWDLVTNHDHLLHTLLGRQLYLRGMGTNVTTLFAHHHTSFLANPEHPASPLVPTILRLKRPTLTDFDHIFTCHASGAAPFPFPSFREYYTWASSHDIADAVRVPVLTINAADDPIVRRVQTPDSKGRENRWVVCAVTPMGGHLGWFAKGKGKRRWTTGPVLEWMELLGRDVVREEFGQENEEMYTDEEGFLRVARWPALGCKEVPGGGVINGNRPETELFQGL
ncbi:Alpha/Beta hydrolase protein [Roridomyces roridus]|uniref:Alpha/Beta hydrolase protein n=1 Tax=Roridomyces roridus TaxID=1738132 RepID=A0AAD7G0Z1_9AGAR|nr:Alpha/Beta hydrolase protein [Roridomyces roridus]